MTVLGPISADDLAVTYMHEHVIVDKGLTDKQADHILIANPKRILTPAMH